MSLHDEVRLYIADDEYEVRALTASELLKARAEARALSRDIGAEDGDEAIVSAAAVVSASLYKNGERAFPAAVDALEGLTLRELLEAAAVNDVPGEREKKAALPDGEEAETVLLKAEEPEKPADEAAERRADAPEVSRMEKPAPYDETEETGHRRARREWDTERPARMEKRERGGLFSLFSRRQGRPDTVPAAGAEREESPMTIIPEAEESYGADMRSISGFFERDSRRYDGAFERY